MSQIAYPIQTFDDIIVHFSDLAELLDLIHEDLMEMDFVVADGKRRHDLDRLAVLTRIGRDLAVRASDETQDFYRSQLGRMSPGPVDNGDSGEKCS